MALFIILRNCKVKLTDKTNFWKCLPHTVFTCSVGLMVFTSGEGSGPEETIILFHCWNLLQNIRYISVIFIIYEFKRNNVKLPMPSPN